MNILFFSLIGYSFSGLFSLGAYKVVKNKNKAPVSRCIRIGVICGILNGAGWLCMAFALKLGKAAIVFPVIGLHILIPILLAMVVYNEKLTKQRTFAIALTIVAIFLLK